MVTSGGLRAGNSNTLPKAGGNGKDGRQIQKVPYTNSEENNDDDKVIYF